MAGLAEPEGGGLGSGAGRGGGRRAEGAGSALSRSAICCVCSPGSPGAPRYRGREREEPGLARFGSGTAAIRVGDRGSRNGPPEWELRSERRRLQRAFRKLEALQEARGADRGGRRELGEGERRMKKRGSRAPPNREAAELGPSSPTSKGWRTWLPHAPRAEPGETGEGLGWRGKRAFRVAGASPKCLAQLCPHLTGP